MPYPLNPQIEAIVEARHADPFAFLGMHEASGGLYVRTMLPGATAVDLIEAVSGETVAHATRLHPDGLFVASVPERSQPFHYRLRASWDGHVHEFEDIYR